MTEILHITADFEDFNAELINLLSEANELNNLPVKSEEELSALKNASSEWMSRTEKLLRESFNIESNHFVNEFRISRPSFYSIPGASLTLKSEADKAKSLLQHKQHLLTYYQKILSISELTISPKKVDVKQRATYTIEEKLSLILNKLYDLYDNDYYSIKDILNGNGVHLRRSDENREFSIMLENSGLIKPHPSDRDYVQITSEGAMFVETNREPIYEDYSHINKTPEEINQAIDEIIENLRNLGNGQEIIFNELEELKSLYIKLNKKTWGQVLKGKLFDLSLGKLVENDTLKFIYETLTDNKLLIP